MLLACCWHVVLLLDGFFDGLWCTLTKGCVECVGAGKECSVTGMLKHTSEPSRVVGLLLRHLMTLYTCLHSQSQTIDSGAMCW